MSEDQSKKRLGRGLAALIGNIDLSPVAPEMGAQTDTRERLIPIEHIARNPRNPRQSFHDTDLDDLARSIREHGIVQPLIVRPDPYQADRFQLIAGERRWRAAQRANLHQVPIIIRDVDERTALEIAIIENIQRSDLNPIEEAMGYQQLLNEHDYTQIDLAHVIGKSRSHVANTLRLLRLPQQVQQYLTDGRLSAGHARCLITAIDPLILAEKIIKEGLSVRQAEALANKQMETPQKNGNTTEKDADTRSLEKLLGDVIGMKVAIKHGKKGGDVKIHYSTLEQLDDICRKLQN